MKGKVTSGDLLKEVLNGERGLRTGRLLSDVFLFDSPLPGDPRLIGITDGGINLAPDLETKAQILTNGLELFRAIGYEKPKVAVLSAIEKVNPDLPSTVDAAELRRSGRNQGPSGPVRWPGPWPWIWRCLPNRRDEKGLKRRWPGRPTFSSFPSIEAANITAKAIQYLAGASVGHVVVGAAAPVLIPSRSESPGQNQRRGAGRIMID